MFDKVYDKLDTFNKKKASMSTWIFTITRNTLIDYYRTNHVYLELKENINIVAEQDDEGLICNKENLEKLSEALKSLNDKERKVIVLQYYDSIPLNTVCKKIGISYAYIKIIHRTALSKISKFFELKDYSSQ